MTIPMESAPGNSIVKSINDYLRKGITAGTDVISFAESTLGITAIDDLARIMSGPDSRDNGLLDLVFSPGHDLRKVIEPLVPMEGLAPADADAIAAAVAGDVRRVDVIIAGCGVHAAVNLAPALASDFVRKLNLCKKLPFRSPADFPDYLSDETVIALRVLVRTSRYRPLVGHDSVIIALIKGAGRLGAGDETALMTDCLSLLLELFSENPVMTGSHAMLAAEKKCCEDILQKASLFGEYIGRYSMEFLMANKVQPPAADIGAIRRRLYLLDLISTAVFGRPAGGDPGELTLQFDRSGD